MSPSSSTPRRPCLSRRAKKARHSPATVAIPPIDAPKTFHPGAALAGGKLGLRIADSAAGGGPSRSPGVGTRSPGGDGWRRSAGGRLKRRRLVLRSVGCSGCWLVEAMVRL
eukprot:2778785-Rhodomonas_salina.3